MEVTLVHALRHSASPIEASFARIWPEARLRTLMDDSLSRDVMRDGGLTPRMNQRFLTLSRYAADCGTDAILFTCSAFGPCIDAVAQVLTPMPVLKPSEAMIEDASRMSRRIGLVATFAPTLATMPGEFPPDVEVTPCMVEGALEALDRGDGVTHDRLVADAAARVLVDCDVICLAQFSLARAAPSVATRLGKPVLTTPDCAVLKLKAVLQESATAFAG